MAGGKLTPTPGGAMTGGMQDQQNEAIARMQQNRAAQEKAKQEQIQSLAKDFAKTPSPDQGKEQDKSR